MKNINNKTSLSIHITNKCNLRCPGCYALSGDRQNTIKFEYITQAIEKINPKNIIFFGGEAILEADIIRKTIEKYPNISFSLHTNGTNYCKENKDIYESIDKIILTLDSFNFEWLSKYKGFTEENYKSFQALINDFNKISVTHNVFASHNDINFLDDYSKYNFPIDWYIFITKSRWQQFFPYFRETMSFWKNPHNTKPKLRLLTDGTITRDMRGIYNICHINDWNEKMRDSNLPISHKCKECRLFDCCLACIQFPHFVKDIIENVDYEPHFCKLTKIFWRQK